jgi:hypothetical protein
MVQKLSLILQEFTFLPFTILLGLFFVFVFLYLPETKVSYGNSSPARPESEELTVLSQMPCPRCPLS